MDMSALAGVFSGLNYARGILQGLLKAKVTLETHAQIDEALEKLGHAQATMFEMQGELFRSSRRTRSCARN